MTLQGKGFFIWNIHAVEGGSPNAIAEEAAKAGLSHVLVKIADGVHSYNIDQATHVDLALPVIQALQSKGIQVWGWHYVYGNDPDREARIAVQRVDELSLQGYVIDAEGEYKLNGSGAAARFMKDLRHALPDLPIALSSYRFPSYHPQFPWQVFLDGCNYNMPQVYWQKAHNPAAQLKRCLQEFQVLDPVRPVMPTGAAYKNQGWAPTAQDVSEFLIAAQSWGLSAANFYSWDSTCQDLKPLWNTIAAFPWPGGKPPSLPDISSQLIAALNTHDPRKIASWYMPDAVHVTSRRTISGSASIGQWYAELFEKSLPGAVLTVAGEPEVDENTCRFNWTATSSKGKVKDGNDTLGLINGQIAYHYTYFTISS